jgi:hypothetical protein
LSAAERILNIIEIKKHFEFNKKFLETIALRNHLLSEAIEESFDKSVDKLEKKLWKIIGTNKANTIAGSTEIDNIFEEEELKEIFKEMM